MHCAFFFWMVTIWSQVTHQYCVLADIDSRSSQDQCSNIVTDKTFWIFCNKNHVFFNKQRFCSLCKIYGYQIRSTYFDEPVFKIVATKMQVLSQITYWMSTGPLLTLTDLIVFKTAMMPAVETLMLKIIQSSKSPISTDKKHSYSRNLKKTNYSY